MIRVQRLAENLHTHLPTIALDMDREKWVSDEATPVAGDAFITALPGHLIVAGGKPIAISGEAIRTALSHYDEINDGGLNRIYALPEVQVDGQPAAMRMAKGRGAVVNEVTEALVSSVLVDAYRESSQAQRPTNFSPLQIVGIINVPTAQPGPKGHDGMMGHGPVAERGAVLMPLVEGEDLHQRMFRGVALSASQTRDLVQGFDRWIAVAAEQGYVHTDLKPANILIAADGEMIIPIDHTLASVTRVVNNAQRQPNSGLKVTAHWFNGPKVAAACEEYFLHRDPQELKVDLMRAQRATVARIALSGFLAHEPISEEDHDGNRLSYYTAINTPSAYEPALAASKEGGLDAETVNKLRTYLQEGLIET